MKTITLKKNSWHYWLATEFGDAWKDDEKSFCSYMKEVMKGMLRLSCVIALLGAALFCTGDMLYYFYKVWVASRTHATIPRAEGPAVVAIIFYIMLIVGFVGVKLQTWKTERRIRKYNARIGGGEPLSDSFLGNAIDTVRNKVCFKVTFK
jgi:hypothetical protein